MAAYNALANINIEQNGDSGNSDHATPPTIVINLNNNTGNVVIGDNNNVTIEHICAPSCGTGLDPCCADASVSDDITTENLIYIRKPFNRDTDVQLSRGTPLPIEEPLARNESSQQHRAECKREKRKEHSLFHEASDFLTRKKNDRKRAKREKEIQDFPHQAQMKSQAMSRRSRNLHPKVKETSILNRDFDCLTISVSVCILFETMANGLASIVLPRNSWIRPVAT